VGSMDVRVGKKLATKQKKKEKKGQRSTAKKD
jgi:hypothetical protein